MNDTSLATRVDALRGAAELAREHLPGDTAAEVIATADKIGARLRHGTEHTVVALVGPTGAGKSSLFNALCGDMVSAPGVRRPTTGAVHACVWADSAGPLLDWLDISRRHHVDRDDRGALGGLVLLDLPDFDSTVAEHRLEVDRLVELVDVLVWVSDPQKYADESLHHGYLLPLAEHGDIMRFVLNKIDTLDPSSVDDVVADFTVRIADDGISDGAVVAVAVTEDRGIDQVRAMLEREVSAKDAAVRRVHGDLAAAARTLRSEGRETELARGDRRALVEGLGRAAGADIAADLTAAQHRRDARDTMGWPVARWLRRRRRHPVAELPRAGASAASGAEVAAALRNAGEAAGEGLGPPWPMALRRAALAQQDGVERALTAVTRSTARSAREKPRWWAAVAWLQRIVGVAALVGGLWLLAVAVLGGFLRLDTDPLLVDTPGAEWIPVPSLLLLGGVLIGLLLALLSRLPVAIGARRRARRTRSTLQREVEAVAQANVIEPLDALLADRREIERRLDIAVGESDGR